MEIPEAYREEAAEAYLLDGQLPEPVSRGGYEIRGDGRCFDFGVFFVLGDGCKGDAFDTDLRFGDHRGRAAFGERDGSSRA